LTITKSIILKHGGEIAMVNRPEGGLRVTVMLPKAVIF
jgi:signal transduction histidine kinase